MSPFAVINGNVAVAGDWSAASSLSLGVQRNSLSLPLASTRGRHKGRNGGRVEEKLHQQHEASITDNHLKRSRSSSEHREERADAHRIQPAVTAAHVHLNRLEFFTDKASLPP
ncbi:hypothetical protein QQF64_003566 [Cirrhinus molitorella]|uniref:Uncharacterized protein n=1 Tax=Cirrhinus molitorella TaxID=172907 RepID=A0ABR3MLN8_9TELE